MRLLVIEAVPSWPDKAYILSFWFIHIIRAVLSSHAFSKLLSSQLHPLKHVRKVSSPIGLLSNFMKL